MSTWSEIRNHAKAQHDLQSETERGFRLTWSDSSGRSQLIQARWVRAFDADWLELKSPVCHAHEMDPTEALKKNNELAVGALAIDDPYMVVVHNVQLDGLAVSAFDASLALIAALADSLELELTGRDHF
jgi:hypothetical protein